MSGRANLPAAGSLASRVNGSLSFLARWLDRRGRRYGRTVQPSTADEAA